MVLKLTAALATSRHSRPNYSLELSALAIRPWRGNCMPREWSASACRDASMALSPAGGRHSPRAAVFQDAKLDDIPQQDRAGCPALYRRQQVQAHRTDNTVSGNQRQIGARRPVFLAKMYCEASKGGCSETKTVAVASKVHAPLDELEQSQRKPGAKQRIRSRARSRGFSAACNSVRYAL